MSYSRKIWRGTFMTTRIVRFRPWRKRLAVWSAAVDAAPPAPPALHSTPPVTQASEGPGASPFAPAATDERPRDDQERRLCEKASHPDWYYLAGLAVLDAGAIFVESQTKNFRVAKPDEGDSGNRAVRFLGPLSMGFMWGATLSGGYLSLSKCSMDWVRSAPPEGDVRSPVPFAIALAMIAGATAPIFLAAGGMGVVGSLLPYLLPPRTWSGARELMHLRAETTPDMKGAFVSYSARF
jgi:hypothetical protein